MNYDLVKNLFFLNQCRFSIKSNTCTLNYIFGARLALQFFFPFASFFQPLPPQLPPLLTVIQTVFVHKKKLKSKPYIWGERGDCPLSSHVHTLPLLRSYLSLCKRSAPIITESRVSFGTIHPAVVKTFAFERKMFVPFLFKSFSWKWTWKGVGEASSAEVKS